MCNKKDKNSIIPLLLLPYGTGLMATRYPKKASHQTTRMVKWKDTGSAVHSQGKGIEKP